MKRDDRLEREPRKLLESELAAAGSAARCAAPQSGLPEEAGTPDNGITTTVTGRTRRRPPILGVALSPLLLSILLSAWPAAPARGGEPPVAAIKHYILIDLVPGADLVQLDRWYLTYHSKEVRRLWGAWQRYYYSYMTRFSGPEADRFNVVRGRMTEIHFDSLEDFRVSRINNEYGLSPFTPPPGGWRGTYTATMATIPTNPNEDFLDAYPPPKETPYYRWIVFFRYPDGVSEEDGESWFLATHAPELALLPGLRRFVAYRTVIEGQAYPRVMELWFDTYEDWRKAVLDEPPQWTPPPWGGEFPFVGVLSAFIGERPDVDFINDDRVIP